MRIVAQRVTRASVSVGGERISEIGEGLLLLIGVAVGDTPATAIRLAEKVLSLRVFEDSDGRMNRSIKDAGGSVLAVSQFTLLGDVRRGNRPSFSAAARPADAIPVLEGFCETVRAGGVPCLEGRFGAHMAVSLENDGPVTILLDSDAFEQPRRP